MTAAGTNVTAAAGDELFLVRPEEFVAARNALVKQLKAAGEREQAAEIATWRRPTPIDWALNQVARRDGDAVAAFVSAAAQAQEAQAAALGGSTSDREARGDLRAAVAAVRQASAEVAGLGATELAGGGRPTAANRAAVSARLAEIAAEPALAQLLAAGRLGAGLPEGETSPFGGTSAEGPPGPRRPATTRTTRRGGAPAEGSAPRGRRATLSVVPEPEREPDGLSAAERAAAKQAAMAAKQAAAAEAKRQREVARAVARAERDVAAARDRLERASAGLDRAEAEQDAARRQLERADLARAAAVEERDRRRAELEAAEERLARVREA